MDLYDLFWLTLILALVSLAIYQRFTEKNDEDFEDRDN